MGFSEIQGCDVFRFIVCPLDPEDPRSGGYLKDAHSLGLTHVTQIRCHDLYFVKGGLTPVQLEKLAVELLHDPVTQAVEWHPIGSAPVVPEDAGWLVEVALRPGVTDPVAEQILRAAHLLGVEGIQAVSTGLRFWVQGDRLVERDLHTLATRLLSNGIIQRYAIGEITPSFPQAAESSGEVETIKVRTLSDMALLDLSHNRRAALDLAEMKSIQSYCQRENRDLTDVEFEMIAQTWSEHCIHKTFKALLTLYGTSSGTLDSLFNTTLKTPSEQVKAPWVHSAFVDNAGIIDFDDEYEISFKVETHNHPSAIEPFGGANTGIGGVIRDVIGVSAKPIAATDVLCFGPQNLPMKDLPEGVLHPRRIASGVVDGIRDYGNKIGIPTLNGAILYDPGYTSNPLVFCGCVGIAPKNSHPHHPQSGDHIIVIGGRTGRDGLRGATFSSMTMDAQTGEVAGASVQIGAPIVEKGLIDVTMIARDRQLYHAITDCGAGGLSSAVGEMSSGIGAVVHLEHVLLKYPGLAPWEIWLSEAQERMVLAVPSESLPALRELCEIYEVELTDIGLFKKTGRLVVKYGKTTVLDLENLFLHKGIPQRKLNARVNPPSIAAGTRGPAGSEPSLGYNQALIRLLSHPNIASKVRTIRVYDHEIQGGTVIKPLTGAQNDGPSDACVIKPIGTRGLQALALSSGINPEYGKRDPYQMALNVIDEAIRNLVAVGASPDTVALLDNFCWGNPRNPDTLGELVNAARGCHDGCLRFHAPFISGKDSLNNEYLGTDGQRHAIPPTLLISAISVMQNWQDAISMDLKEAGNLLYQVGPFAPVLGGSHYHLVCAPPDRHDGDGVPICLPEDSLAHFRALHRAMQNGLVRACHDLSEGGMGVSAAEMCIGGRLGLDLRLQTGDPLRELFGESAGCFLVEVSPAKAAAFESAFAGLDAWRLGTVSAEPVFAVHYQDQQLINLPVSRLVSVWQPVEE